MLACHIESSFVNDPRTDGAHVAGVIENRIEEEEEVRKEFTNLSKAVQSHTIREIVCAKLTNIDACVCVCVQFDWTLCPRVRQIDDTRFLETIWVGLQQTLPGRLLFLS